MNTSEELPNRVRQTSKPKFKGELESLSFAEDEVNPSDRWQVLGAALRSLFEPPRMVRLVGPNEKPLERYEFIETNAYSQTLWCTRF